MIVEVRRPSPPFLPPYRLGGGGGLSDFDGTPRICPGRGAIDGLKPREKRPMPAGQIWDRPEMGEGTKTVN